MIFVAEFDKTNLYPVRGLAFYEIQYGRHPPCWDLLGKVRTTDVSRFLMAIIPCKKFMIGM